MAGLEFTIGREILMVRDAVKADEDFIYATWLRGLHFGNSWFKQIPDRIYYETYHQVIETVLARPTTTIKVCCFQDEPNVITGYAVYTTTNTITTLHWVFVKTAWRKLGIATRLLPPSISQVTHLTTVGQHIKPKEWAFNPFAL